MTLRIPAYFLVPFTPMTPTGPPTLTPLGQLLEHARLKVLHISGREAARRAGMSEGRWRQVVRGFQARASGDIPVSAPARTIVAMALAVEVDPAQALGVAGIEATEEDIEAMVRRRDSVPAASDAGLPEERKLVEEIERIRHLRGYSPDEKIRMVNVLIDLHEERDAGSEDV